MARLCTCILAAALTGFGAPAVFPSPGAARAQPDEAPRAWSPPVEARVVEPFVPGIGAYEVSGHAGVDYATSTGTSVRAAGDGVVAFTGDIAGATFVVVAHGGGLRTTYGQLASIGVHRLQTVERGDVVGTAGGGGMHDHAAGLLHFGLRVDGRPVDPLALFERPNLTEIVHLVPSDDAFPDVASAVAERRLAAEWFLPPGASFLDVCAPAPGIRGLVHTHACGGGGGGGGGLLGGVLSRIGVGARWLGERATVLPLTALEAAMGGGAVLAAARAGVADWWALRKDCTPLSSSAGFAGTGNHLVVVGGVNSWTRSNGHTNALAPDRLGYGDGDVTWFSYAPDAGPYTREETHAGPEVAASRLAGQLRELARRHGRPPAGRPVDLIGHSQGGVVVEAFLKLHYAGHEDEYPPIGEVVTMAAPHHGAPLATLLARLDGVPGAGRAVGLFGDFPGPDSPSTRQLAEGSAYLDRLRGTPLPPGLDVTTVGAAGDLLVPADQTSLPGVTHVVTDPPGFWADHGAILTDPEALGAVRLALAGLPPPCRTLAESVRNRVEPEAIHAAERLLLAPRTPQELLDDIAP